VDYKNWLRRVTGKSEPYPDIDYSEWYGLGDVPAISSVPPWIREALGSGAGVR
jgi:hypothetical protein